MRKTKTEKGITLIALIITIVVLLILAVVAINSIKNDGILSYAGNAANDYNEAVKNEQGLLGKYEEYLKDHSGSGNNAVSGEWTQSRTSVTNGAVTLNVGQTVTGYTSPEGTTDPGWAVLGAENGKLLLVSKSNVQDYVGLYGKEGDATNGYQAGYNNGIAYLNSVCEPYLNSSLADEARSIKVEDINRVTGYNPETAGYGAGTTQQYGNTVTYTMSGNYVAYTSDSVSGTNGKGESSYTKFDHVDGRTLKIDSEGKSNSINVESNGYYYMGSTYLTGTTSDAYKVLFKKANGTTDDYYWLASQYQFAGTGAAYFGLRNVGGGTVDGDGLWGSGGGAGDGSRGVRAVVSLKSGVNISSSGVIS